MALRKFVKTRTFNFIEYSTFLLILGVITAGYGNDTDNSNGFNIHQAQQSCDFESDTDGFCGWGNTGWTRTMYASDSSLTGPSQAKQGEYYIYTKWNTSLHQAMINITVNAPQCLLFWYHMYGSHIANLTVMAAGQTLWIRAGDQSNVWQCGTVGISHTFTEVMIVAKKGPDLHNVIALDHIRLVSDIPCNSIDCNFSASQISSSPSRRSTEGTTTLSTEMSVTPTASKESPSWLSQNLSVVIAIPCGVLAVCVIVVVVVVCYMRRNQGKLINVDGLENRQTVDRQLSERYNPEPNGGTTSVYEVADPCEYSELSDYITPIHTEDDGYAQHIDLENLDRNTHENDSFTLDALEKTEPDQSESIRRESDSEGDEEGYVKPNDIRGQQ